MRAKLTPIDSATDLIVQEDGALGIRWAECFYGPEDAIEKLAEGELLTQCREAINRNSDAWITGRLVDPDDGLGTRFLETKE